MKHREIHKNIYWIGVNDRETYLFESLWPLPQGVAYNSYAITDKKVAIIDTVKGSYDSQFIEKLKELLNGRKPDYLIINHMEPDHSGSIKILIEIYPNITIVGNQKTIEFLNGFYGEFKNTLVVKEKDVLNLGEYELEFYLTPMVHCPETMMTYEKKTKTLFSGDAFGGFGTLDGGIFDDEVNTEFYEYETLRYYSNIVGKYAVMVNAAVSRLKEFAKNIGWQVIEPEIEVKHAPKQQDLENCFKLGKELGARL